MQHILKARKAEDSSSSDSEDSDDSDPDVELVSDSEDDDMIDKELIEGVSRARADARKRSNTSSASGNNSFQRNLLRQMQGQSKEISALAHSMVKLADAHTSSKESSSSSSITSNQEMLNEIKAIIQMKEAGYYTEAEAAQQIEQAKAALKSHQDRKSAGLGAVSEKK